MRGVSAIFISHHSRSLGARLGACSEREYPEAKTLVMARVASRRRYLSGSSRSKLNLEPSNRIYCKTNRLLVRFGPKLEDPSSGWVSQRRGLLVWFRIHETRAEFQEIDWAVLVACRRSGIESERRVRRDSCGFHDELVDDDGVSTAFWSLIPFGNACVAAFSFVLCCTLD